VLLLHRLNRRVRAQAKRLQDDPLFGLGYLVATALAVAGIGQSVEWVLASRYPKALFLALLGLVCLMLVAYLRRPPAMRFFNISRLGKVISLSQHQEIMIDADGWAHLRFLQSVVFLETPEPEDYRDKLHCDERMDFDLLNYESPDSEPIRIVRENKSLVAVYFRPHAEAETLQPWPHQFSFDIPENVGPDYYCVRIAIHTPVGLSSVRVSSALPLERVICFKEPRSVSGRDYDRLARYALRHVDSDAPPAEDESPTGFQWRIARPEVGQMYNLTVFFKGGVERFQTSQLWRARIARRWRRLRGTERASKRTRDPYSVAPVTSTRDRADAPGTGDGSTLDSSQDNEGASEDSTPCL
jgi:hypothetical protein